MAKFSRGAARALALVAVLSLLLAVPVAADSESPSRLNPDGDQSRPDVSELSPEFVENLWFVEFEGEPLARGGSQAQHARERVGLERAAERSGIDFEQRFDFQRLWNGLSVRATASDVQKLAEAADVAAVYPVARVEAPEPDEVDPEMATALTMTGADIAQSELGLTGDGLSVAIVDTGIDYGHPDLGGDGEGTSFPTDRVTHGFDYVGEEYDASDPENDEPEPDPDPMDFQGHGTHVAGIVGADAADEDGVTGVAPGVTFGAYKVFAQGSSSSDVIVAALEDAHADGMDIVNMSLGAAFTWGDYPTSQASDTLVDEGTVVVSSIGNSGREGVFSSGAPGNAAKSIGVASADNLEMNANVFEIAGEEIPWVGIGSAPPPPTEGESDPIEWIGRACASLGDELEGDPDGKVALITRGECTFEEKYNVAVDAGATAVLIHNNIPGLFSGGGIVPQDDIWAAAMTLEDGQWLRDLLDSTEDDVTITYSDGETSVINPSAGLLSDFSSYGMTPDLQVTPDITAPGGLIMSTYPLAQGGYATISGTSMSSPHVAGAVALLLEDQPDLGADEVRPVLQNSAEPLAWSLAPDAGFLEPSFRQGAGMLQIDEAITATTSVSPNKIALEESEVAQTTLEISNHGDEAVTYHLGNAGTIGTGGFGDDPWGDWATIIYPQFVGPTTDAQFSQDSVTVPAGQSASVDVTIVNPHFGLYAHQAGGFLTVTEDGADAPTSVVPYAGLAGNLSDIEIFPNERPDAIGLDNALVVAFDEDGNLVLPEDPTFDIEAGDEPVAGVFQGFQARRLEVEAVHESGYRVPVAEEDFTGRSGTEAQYATYAWDGREAVGNSGSRPAPSGTYTFEVRALTVGADADDADAWETTTSGEFELVGGRGTTNGGQGQD